MKAPLIKINNDSIRIRPSAVESFFSCPFAWGKTFLEGCHGKANSRASIGTAIHAGVEAMWNEAISKNETKAEKPNLSMMTDAAMEAWKEDTADGVQFGKDETEGTCAVEIIKGTEAFIEDIVPFTTVPRAVETFYKIDIPDHPLVSELGGTVDYISKNTIADVKTTKRKSGPEGHTVQQSIYKYLANENGENITTNLIQQVVLKKAPEASIQVLEADIPQAKWLMNTMLDALELVAKDVAPIETILRPNPKHMFCSQKFCAHYNTCPAVKGNLMPAAAVPKIKL
jgi:hypothetical protein